MINYQQPRADRMRRRRAHVPHHRADLLHLSLHRRRRVPRAAARIAAARARGRRQLV